MTMVAVTAAVVSVPAFALAARPGHHPRPTTSAAATTQSVSALPVMQVVQSDERITASSAGAGIWLDSKGLYLASPGPDGVRQPNLLQVTDMKPGQISTLASGATWHAVLGGIYCGTFSQPVKVTIKQGGLAVTAKVISLPGAPGWFAFYTDASIDVGSDDKPTVYIDGADGTRLVSSKL